MASDADSKLNLVENVIQLIKKDQEVASVLKKTVAITKGAKNTEKDTVCKILTEVLDNLKLCKTPVELEEIEAQMTSLFLPKDLRPVLLNSTQYTIKLEMGNMLGFPVPVPIILGRGGCGTVVMGTLTKNNKNLDVAVKQAHGLTNEVLKMTLNEAQAMVNLKHCNVVAILGYEKIYGEIIMEHMAYGDLQKAMQKITFTKNNLLDFIIEICKGMTFIDSKKYIHRSLKVSNVMLSDKKKVKIGDFGFAQYVGNTGGVYTDTMQRGGFQNSPESFHTKQYRIQSDVYSMGLLIWDLFFELKKDERHLAYIQHLQMTHEQAGARLPRPPKCPKVIFYYVKEHCLNPDYKLRPTFTEIQNKVLSVLVGNMLE